MDNLQYPHLYTSILEAEDIEQSQLFSSINLATINIWDIVPFHGLFNIAMENGPFLIG